MVHLLYMFWKTQTKLLIFPIGLKAFRSYFFQNREITHSKVIAHVMQICITFVLNEFLKNPPLKRYTQSIIRGRLYDIFSLPCIFIRIRPAYTFFSSNVARDNIEFDTPALKGGFWGTLFQTKFVHIYMGYNFTIHNFPLF